MNCREFERRLDESAPLDPEAARHLESCALCRDLSELARASLDGAPPPGTLLAGVVAVTSGPACVRAGELLPGFADGALRGPERDLIAMHVADCARCGEVVATLGWMSRELPALAAIDPGEEFTAAVLRATRAAAADARRAPVVRRWWEAIRDRPRISWEAAYVGALVVWLLFGAGFAPFREVPAQALEVARSVPVRDLAGGVEPASLGRQVWQATGAPVMERARVTTEGLSGAREASASLARHGAEALGSALRGDLSGSAVRLKQMGGDLRRLHEELRRRGTERKPGSQEV